MKRTININIIVIVFMISGFTLSCAFEEDVQHKEVDILTSTAWVPEKSSLAGIENGINDFEKDDSWRFSSDNTFTSSKGLIRWDSEENDEIGTWTWKDDKTKLIIVTEKSTTEFKIIDLTSTTLKVSWNDFGVMTYKAKSLN